MKSKVTLVIGIIIVLAVLILSFIKLGDNHELAPSKDIVKTVTLDGKKLDVTFYGGYSINEEITFGNKITKIIKVTNNNKEDITFALSFSDVSISNEKLTYSIYKSTDNDAYEEILSNTVISTNSNLAYNIVADSESDLYLKIEFLSNAENINTKVKGKLSIITNLTDKEIFKKKVLVIHSELLNKIDKLNGINQKGYYILNIDSLEDNIKDKFSGYILINANDYSNLEYYYFINDGKYMLNNIKIDHNDFSKKDIANLDNNINNNFNSVCSTITKKGCSDFNTITYNESGGKKNFYQTSMDIIKKCEDIKLNDKKVYVLDVKQDIKNDSNIRGYILINNTNKPELFLYLTNEIYMISGYNYTKLGSFSEGSSTIRTYSESAFRLSSSSKSAVCSFSGFNECYNLDGSSV